MEQEFIGEFLTNVLMIKKLLLETFLHKKCLFYKKFLFISKGNLINAGKILEYIMFLSKPKRCESWYVMVKILVFFGESFSKHFLHKKMVKVLV